MCRTGHRGAAPPPTREDSGTARSRIISAADFAAASAVGGAGHRSGDVDGRPRVAPGVFAGLLAPATLVLLAVTFPGGRERANAFSIFSTAAMSGAATGLIGGGIFTLARHARRRYAYRHLGRMELITRIPGHDSLAAAARAFSKSTFEAGHKACAAAQTGAAQ